MDTREPPLSSPANSLSVVDPVERMLLGRYERAAIQRWLQGHNTSPLTRQRISASLTPCFTVKKLVAEWQEKLAAITGQDRIPFEELELNLGDLGYGSFKRVQKGRWRGQLVAVATVLDNDVVLEDEVHTMRVVGRHPHILSLHGIARDNNGKEHLVQELASHGSLLDALDALADEDMMLEPPVFLSIAQQVCEAMQAMAHAGLVHRDLAARNVLLATRLDPADPRSVNIKVRILNY